MKWSDVITASKLYNVSSFQMRERESLLIGDGLGQGFFRFLDFSFRSGYCSVSQNYQSLGFIFF